MQTKHSSSSSHPAVCSCLQNMTEMISSIDHLKLHWALSEFNNTSAHRYLPWICYWGALGWNLAGTVSAGVWVWIPQPPLGPREVAGLPPPRPLQVSSPSQNLWRSCFAQCQVLDTSTFKVPSYTCLLLDSFPANAPLRTVSTLTSACILFHLFSFLTHGIHAHNACTHTYMYACTHTPTPSGTHNPHPLSSHLIYPLTARVIGAHRWYRNQFQKLFFS